MDDLLNLKFLLPPGMGDLLNLKLLFPLGMGDLLNLKFLLPPGMGDLLYPPQTKFWRVHRNHPVRLSLVSATPPKRLIGFL